MRRNGKRGGARRSSNKGISELIQTARDQNWVVISSAGGHWIFRPPDKSMPQVVASGTPGGNNRSVENTKAQLKRSGLVLNGRRRLRRNPSMTMGTKVKIGVAAVAGLVLLRVLSLRAAFSGGFPGGPAAPGVVMAPGAAALYANPNAAAAIAARREPVFATASSLRGLGGYYRS